mgnify:CR=1 FL=1
MRRDPILGAAIKTIGACGMADRQRDRSSERAGRRHRQPAAVDEGGRDDLRPLRRAVSRRSHSRMPQRSPAHSDAVLRSVGLSGQKVGYLRDLSARIDGRPAEARRARRSAGRSGDRAAGRGEGLRALDRGDVPDVPAASPRRACRAATSASSWRFSGCIVCASARMRSAC